MVSDHDPSAAVRGGTLGRFWWQGEGLRIDDSPEPGYVKQSDDGTIQVELLSEGVPSSRGIVRRGIPPTRAIVGTTRKSGIILLHKTRSSYRWHSGRYGNSVISHWFQGFVYEVWVDKLKSLEFNDVSAYFPLGLRWASMGGVEVALTVHEDAEVPSQLTYTLRDERVEETAKIAAGLSVVLSPHWTTHENEGDVIIDTSLEVTCKSERPVEYTKLLEVLIEFQDLINLAFPNAVLASKGRASPVYDVEARERAVMWHSALMMDPVPDRQPVRHEEPYFSLADVGGAKGVARWLKLCRSNRRLTQLVGGAWRSGNRPAETRLLEAAVAIEHIVVDARVRGRPKWATARRDGNMALLLARRGGPTFKNWLQDVDEWAKLFWLTYGQLKHRISSPQTAQVTALADVGWVLVVAYVLDRVSLTKAASRRLLGDYRLESAAREAQRVVQQWVNDGRPGVEQKRRRRRRATSSK